MVRQRERGMRGASEVNILQHGIPNEASPPPPHLVHAYRQDTSYVDAIRYLKLVCMELFCGNLTLLFLITKEQN